MAKKASTYLTGGGGFNFEDAIAVHYLVTMLAELHPFGDSFGRLKQILWQASDAGHALDDLVLIGAANARASHSIKSDAHLNSAGFSADFVSRCWQQLHGSNGNGSGGDDQLLCLAVGTIAAPVNRAWHLLSNQIQVSSPERIEQRLQPPADDDGSQASEFQRDMVKSVIDRAPAGHNPTTLEALRLLKQVRVKHFDFLEAPSQIYESTIDLCQRLVESGQRDDAVALWTDLVAIAKDYREAGGDLTRTDLVQRIAKHHPLRALPNYAPYLERWRLISIGRLQRAGWGVSQQIPPFDRRSVWEAWEAGRDVASPTVLVGASGSGKTSLAREHAKRSARPLYVLDETLLSPTGELSDGLLSGSKYRLAELLAAEYQRSLLVIDAIEKLSDDQLQSVCSLLAGIERLILDDHLQVVFTCQPSAVGRLRVALLRAGITASYVQVPRPTQPELVRSLAQHPLLRSLASRESTIGLLTHLKVFELVCRAAESGIAVAGQGVVKQTDILEFLWTHWIEQQGRSLIRSSLLQRLSIVDAARLASGHALRDLNPTELELIPGLLDDGLLVRFEERIHFAHDFVADLSRLRVLLAGSVADVARHSHNFQWHEAVRLYSQHVVEDSPDRWLAASTELHRSADQAPLCNELFMDGLVSAADADPEILRQLWPRLGELHRRSQALWISRVAIVGTRPDERWRRSLPPGIASEPGPWRHCDGQALATTLELLAACFPLSSELVPGTVVLCEMVLRRAYIAGDVPGPVRGHAALLSLRLAEEFWRDDSARRELRDCAEGIYRSLLLAAQESPAEVAELALLISRRPVASTAPQEQVTDDRDVELAPAPDWLGPLDRVSSTFRRVCLESNALFPLIEINPAVAREIVFACAIEPPHANHYHSWDDDDLGIVEDHYGDSEPIYDRGPYLHFFRNAPGDAAAIMVTLCNLASDRWYDSEARLRLEDPRTNHFGERLSPFAMKIPLPSGDSAVWKGSANIYRWSGGGLPPCKIITNLLMAFEFWIYEEIEAKRSVDAILSRVVSEGRSAGLAGGLIDIGKKHPHLFLGPLRPLLGCWAFYGWDKQVRIERSSFHEGIAGWGTSHDQMGRARAHRWHRAEHRSRDLLNIAQYFFMHDESFRSFMEHSRQSWELDFSTAGPHHSLSDLARVFDWTNYRISETGDGQRQIEYALPEEVTRAAMARYQEIEERQLLMIFPFQCRQLSKKSEQLSADQNAWIWQTVAVIRNHDEDSENCDDPLREAEWSRKPDAFAAAAATLLRRGGDALSDEQREFCRATFEELLTNAPRRRNFDLPESVGDLSWDFFLAEMTVEYLAADPTDEAARWGLERCLTAYHYRALNYFLKLARDARHRIPDVFPLLNGYVLYWSALREQFRRLHADLAHFERVAAAAADDDDDIAITVNALRTELVRLYENWDHFSQQVVDGEPSDTTATGESERSTAYLQEASRATGLVLFHQPRRRGHGEDVDHADVGLDLFVLQYGSEWIDLGAVQSEVEFQQWSAWLAGLMDLQLKLIPELTENEQFSGYGYAHEFDYFVDRLLACSVVHAGRPEVQPLWERKLREVSSAPRHVTNFLDLCCAVAHDHGPVPVGFARLWLAMITFAVESAEWSPPDNIPPDAWCSLLGMDFRTADQDWKMKVADEMRRQPELLAAAFASALRNRDTATALVGATCDELWAFYRLSLLALFARQVPGEDGSESPAKQITMFLGTCWSEHGAQIAANAEYQQAFTALLNRAVQCGYPPAVRLAETVNATRPT